MTHEFDGKKYEQASAHQKEWGTRIILELDPRGTERILDLGCGDGTLTSRLADLVPNGDVTGIDASQGMIDAARPKERSHLRFILMDIDRIDFDERFDIVFSNATLHWVKDHRRLLKNVRRALRPGGRLRFNFAAEENCANFFKVIREAMSKEPFPGYFKDFEWPWYMPAIEEYSTLMKGSGLDDVKVWGENADRFFPDAEAMIRWIDQPSIVPFLIRIDERHKKAFRDFVVARMIEETRQGDGRCFETFRRVNVFARK
ncbi:MAG: methyltransferase domain-containing protein [Proteobacteria bacterium]|nr:methyltransferase domain-containing protein [Pseudomonadota bacterium]